MWISALAARFLKPRMLIGGVVHHEVDQYAHSALLTATGELHEVAQRAIARTDAIIVCYIAAVVPVRRGLEGHEPERGDADPLKIIQTDPQDSRQNDVPDKT